MEKNLKNSLGLIDCVLFTISLTLEFYPFHVTVLCKTLTVSTLGKEKRIGSSLTEDLSHEVSPLQLQLLKVLCWRFVLGRERLPGRQSSTECAHESLFSWYSGFLCRTR